MALRGCDWGSEARRLAVGAVLMVVVCGAAWGRDRLHRHYDATNGLPVSYVTSVEQGARGFLWIGTTAGVVRYDGVSMRRWSQEVDAYIVPGTGRSREVFVAAGPEKRLHRAVEHGLELVPGAETFHAEFHAVSDDGAVWIANNDLDGERVRILRRDPDTGWREVPYPAPLAPDTLQCLLPGRDGAVLISDRRYLARIGSSGKWEVLAAIPHVVHALERADGSVLGVSGGDGWGHVFEIRDGAVRKLWSRPRTRMLSVVERGRAIWVSTDLGLVVLRPEEAPENITDRDGQHGGGALFVDREGSLWAASWRGLDQYPEPDAASWFGEHPYVLRFLARSPDAIWATGWGYLLRARFENGTWNVRLIQDDHWSACCVDARGVVWTTRGHALLKYTPDENRIGLDEELHITPCSLATGGGLWMPTSSGILRMDAQDRMPRLVPGPPVDPGGDKGMDVVEEDGAGNLWAARGERACHARLANGVPQPPWTCGTIDGAELIQGFARASAESFWIVTMKAGVYRVDEGKSELIPGSLDLPVRWISGATASPRGGVWIAGNGFCVRVVDRPDLPAGWEVVERLSYRNGLPTLSITKVVEDADGTLWLATDASLVQVLPSAREDHSAPPQSVAIVEAVVDGKRVAADRPLQLSYDRNRLELRFAPLSFIDPANVRYRVRLRSTDPWSEPIAEPFFRYVDVPPGRYAIEVAATLDGVRWSAQPARVEFGVGSPWYLQAWFVALALSTLAAAAWVTHRARLRIALRIERERTRIAMDLHDDIGSGLGSIGILAGLAAQDGAGEEERRDLAREIGSAAAELGDGLTDLVASLRPGAETLGALGLHLVERARRLFPNGATELVVQLAPGIDDVGVSLSVRRNVLLVGLEALHNAAKHAGARKVVLRLAPADRRWRLDVEDDGQGLRTESEARLLGGLGLESMARRAEEIGADLVLGPRPGGGTLVSLVFEPRAEDRRIAPSDRRPSEPLA